MLTEALTVIFPHQLFRYHPAIQKERKIFLIEETLFFKQLNFHKQKLILHRASMRFYCTWLKEKNYTVEYVEANEDISDIRKFIQHATEINCKEIHVAEVADDWLNSRLTETCKEYNIDLKIYTTPYFLTSLADANAYFGSKKDYFQTDFYIHQRKQLNILLDADNHPVGGKWSFDYENRKRFPKKETVPDLHLPKENTHVTEARKYIEKNFCKNYGNADAPFDNAEGFYPTTFAEAQYWLRDFIRYRFEKFGEYEDAIVENKPVLHHSVLSSSLNIGLLTPKELIDTITKHAESYKIPVNSFEGFIRQIIGWREFIRIVYERSGRKERTKNYWNFTRKMPSSFWKGTTGIAPIDSVIKKVLQSAYTHHIERLMVLGNFMLLCEFDPDEVYKFFMELFIDSYDWVMVPNVYGMSQFADGGLMSTKPYISASNYLIKMSDFEKGEWQQTWDALFWRFLHVHRDYFETNKRIGVLLKTLDKMDKEKLKTHLDIAEQFLKQLDNC